MKVSLESLVDLIEYSQVSTKVYDENGNEQVIEYLDGRKFRRFLADLIEESPTTVFGHLRGMTIKEAKASLAKRSPFENAQHGVDKIVQPFGGASDTWGFSLLTATQLGWEQQYPKRTLIVFCRQDGMFGPLRISDILDYVR